MTQLDRTPAGVRSFREVIAAAQTPAGACPAITIIMITAMSRAPGTGHRNGTADFGIHLGERRGQGLGTEATRVSAGLPSSTNK